MTATGMLTLILLLICFGMILLAGLVAVARKKPGLRRKRPDPEYAGPERRGPNLSDVTGKTGDKI